VPSVNVAVASTSGVFIGTCVSDLFPRSLSLKLSAATALASGTALEFIALNETNIFRVGQKRICTPYMTVCKVISLLKLPYIHRICICMYGFGQPCTYRRGQL